MSEHPEAQASPERRGWLLSAAAALVGLFGLASRAGGAWLIALGGSCYYGIAGIGMLAAAVLLWRRRLAALHLLR